MPEDDAAAVKWYRNAAEQGHADAQFNLGTMYANGDGVPEDDATAMKWYRKAAEQRHAHAQFMLSCMPKAGSILQLRKELSRPKKPKALSGSA